MATIFLPTALRRMTGGKARVQTTAENVGDLLDTLDRLFPGMKQELCDDRGEVRSFINIFVNGTELRHLQGLQTPLREVDEVAIIPAMAGGRFTPERGAR